MSNKVILSIICQEIKLISGDKHCLYASCKSNCYTIAPTKTPSLPRKWCIRVPQPPLVFELSTSILILLTGSIECTAVLGNDTYHGASEIYVYRFTIESLSRTILIGSNTSVICTVYPSDQSAGRSLKMCRNGQLISGELLLYR